MLVLNTLHYLGKWARASLFHKLDPAKSITFPFVHYSDNFEKKDITQNDVSDSASDDVNADLNADVAKVTREVISVETSIKYMTSDAYKQTYGDEPVWKPYRRNHKGMYPPRKTRKTCIRGGQISTGNPCPICRDEYLILDHRNVKLLEQFINEYNGDVLSYEKTGICQKRHKELLVALIKAKDYGTITFDVPIRQYDYSEWQASRN